MPGNQEEEECSDITMAPDATMATLPSTSTGGGAERRGVAKKKGKTSRVRLQRPCPKSRKRRVVESSSASEEAYSPPSANVSHREKSIIEELMDLKNLSVTKIGAQMLVWVIRLEEERKRCKNIKCDITGRMRDDLKRITLALSTVVEKARPPHDVVNLQLDNHKLQLHIFDLKHQNELLQKRLERLEEQAQSMEMTPSQVTQARPSCEIGVQTMAHVGSGILPTTHEDPKKTSPQTPGDRKIVGESVGVTHPPVKRPRLRGVAQMLPESALELVPGDRNRGQVIDELVRDLLKLRQQERKREMEHEGTEREREREREREYAKQQGPEMPGEGCPTQSCRRGNPESEGAARGWWEQLQPTSYAGDEVQQLPVQSAGYAEPPMTKQWVAVVRKRRRRRAKANTPQPPSRPVGPAMGGGMPPLVGQTRTGGRRRPLKTAAVALTCDGDRMTYAAAM